MGRPARAPGLLAAVEASLSARIAKRVKENPALAEGWAWSEQDGVTRVKTDDPVVELRAESNQVELAGIRCSCLLAPKCVHIFAVVTALPDPAAAAQKADVGGAPASPLPGLPASPASPAPAAPTVCLSAEQAAAAKAVEAVLIELLAEGAHGVGLLGRAELSRVGYLARETGLHRLGRVLSRLVRQLRLLEAGHAGFTLSALVLDLREAALLSRSLGAGAAPAAAVGTARREYGPAGHLRLFGLLSEPVFGAGGVAGVVTTLADAQGGRWTVPDLRPRPSAAVMGLYGVAPPVSSLPHERLSREGLFIKGATASVEGRLGAGSGVAAVRAAGGSFSAPPLSAAWERPLPEQLRRAFAEDSDGLVFIEGEVQGVWRDALVLTGPCYVLVGTNHKAFPWRDNLKLLARCPGLALRLVGRVVPDRPRAVIGLALSAPGLQLPAEWGGRVNLGFDRLTTAHAPGCAAAPIELDGQPPLAPDPSEALRRRVERAVLGGPGSLPGAAFGQLSREVGALRGHLMATGADLLAALAGAARSGDAAAFAERWLAAALYAESAQRRLAEAAWEARAGP